MKTLLLISTISIILASCGNSKDKPEDSSNSDSLQSGSISEKHQQMIRDIANKECQVWNAEVRLGNDPQNNELKERLNQLRQEKREMIDNLRKEAGTDEGFRKLKKEINQIRTSDEFCTSVKHYHDSLSAISGSEKAMTEQTDLAGAAKELAVIRCRMKQIKIEYEKRPDDKQLESEFHKLKKERIEYVKQLMKKYGAEIMTKTYFRDMVIEEEKKIKNCH